VDRIREPERVNARERSYLLETMAPPTPLTIATSSVQRLVTEEASYHRELQQQEERIKRLEAEQIAAGEDDDGNREYTLKQEVGTRNLSLSFSLLPFSLKEKRKKEKKKKIQLRAFLFLLLGYFEDADHGLSLCGGIL
jgi:tubulin-specific chaperone A